MTLAAVLCAMAAPVWPAPAGVADRPWLGVATPEARAKRIGDMAATYREPTFALPAPAVADPRYADLRGADLMQWVAEIVALTHRHRPAGERFWGRIAGTAAERAAADYLAEQFRAFGLADIRTEAVHGQRQWWPKNWAVAVPGDVAYGPGTADISLDSAFPALHLATGALSVAGREAELVYAGLGRPVDLLGRDLRGKVALVRSVLQADPFFQSARGHVNELARTGAVGVLTFVDAPGNLQYALENMGPTDIPAFVLGGDDGRFLEEALAASAPVKPLRVRLTLDSEVRDSWQGRNVIGVVPGSSDENVVVLAHLDSYFEGADDNAGGLAALLALARHYRQPGIPPPRRSLIFLGTSGHHEFSDGTAAFIASHGDLLQKTVLVMNLEHPASVLSYFRGPLKLERVTVPGQLTTANTETPRSLAISNGNPLLQLFYAEAAQRYGVVLTNGIERRPTGDAFGFAEARKTVAQIIESNLWFHSSGDVPATLSAPGMERAVRLYAEVLDRVDGTSRAELERRSP